MRWRRSSSAAIWLRGVKPVHWCFDCGSALAEAEIEYADKTSPAVDVAYAARRCESACAAMFGAEAGDAEVAVPIWTTTPWTLPASLAVTLGPDLDYVLVEGPARGGKRVLLVLAEALAESRAAALWRRVSRACSALPRARRWKACSSQHPFYARVVPVILGDHVTTEAGTGAVHTAPGHGQEDFVVGQKYGLSRSRRSIRSTARACTCRAREIVRRPVHLEGQRHHHRIAARARRAAGFGEARPTATRIAGGTRRRWRSAPRRSGSSPWSRPNLRDDALAAIKDVQLDSRLGRGAHRRHDRRPSGLVHHPPAHLGRADRVVRPPGNRRAASAQRRADAQGRRPGRADGVDAWFDLDAAELLGDEAADYDKVTDILDVWFDSGVTHEGVLAARPEHGLHKPADLYLEGSDQHRGWFQSSLLTGIAMDGAAPYRQVLTHGFTVDAHGRKMSKSIGNVVEPQKVIDTLGADVLRLWVASRRLPQRDVGVRRNPQAQCRCLSPHSQYRAIPAGQPGWLRSGHPSGAREEMPAAGPVGDGARARVERASHGKPIGDYDFARGGRTAAEFLQQRPRRAVPGRDQGPPVHDAGRQPWPPLGADRDVSGSSTPSRAGSRRC